MRAAVNHLASVTLELGGKSPVYVHCDANIKDAAEKITAAKLVNAGQSCIAPDYILVHHDVKEELISALNKSFTTFYDMNRKGDQKNFSSIINQRQYEHLEHISPQQKQDSILKEKLLFEPVIIKETTTDNPSMQVEIFGPVLPVIGVMNEEEALKLIHQYPEPLCIYIFTRHRALKNYFTNNTRSGGVCFNDCAVQFLHPGLPFGGMHQSGIGRAHGKAGFLAFSDERVIFEQRIGFTMAKLLYPPYPPLKKKLVDFILKYL